jgi:isopenicillin N synthase-like dioxygenase
MGATLPVIDVAPLVGGRGDAGPVADAIDDACRRHGFFVVVGHAVDPAATRRLIRLAREFFALPETEKAEVTMARGGRAWRGWFPVGGELTSGTPDRKEGLYFGAELSADAPRVAAGLPLHGPNLFPLRPADLRRAVLDHLAAMTTLGHALVAGLGLGLGLGTGWFDAHLTHDPVVLLRIFHYPPAPPVDDGWGVGEHTDYGLLTILGQDDHGGLEVHTPDGWIATPPVEGSFVCNLGDMLERMTGGRYRSTPHRVRNRSGRSRISLPFFFDPSWDAEVRPLPLAADAAPAPAHRPRWDGADPRDFEGTYGEYLLAKVAKVFPGLGGQVLDLPDGPVGPTR